ncbi:MAG TPA: biopolymer transporter ExbD [Steroidobacteraceae bacterium]
MKSRRLSSRLRREEQEMNITAFMNLMVALVPFLLITAVFSRLAIQELNLPGPGAVAAQEDKPTFELEVIAYKDRIVVADRSSGPLSTIPALPSGHDYVALREKLKQIKAEFRDLTAATILLEPDTPYDVLVQLMDTVRTFPAVQGSQVVQAELFPEISVGDAPT